MRSFFTFLILNFINPVLGFSQDIIKDQTDSIYKVNKVKTKIEQTNGSIIGRVITNYAPNGKERERIELDTTGKMYSKKVFEYDSTAKCRRIIEYSYTYEDSITKEELTTPYADSNYIYITTLEYYKNNMLRFKTQRKFNGELYSKESYTYKPKIEIEQYFQSGKVVLESKIYFLGNGLMKRQLRHTGDKTQKWDFAYTYKYDPDGQVIETKLDIKYSAINKEYYHKINYPVRETYVYFPNGLLRSFTDFYENRITWMHNFTYEYW